MTAVATRRPAVLSVAVAIIAAVLAVGLLHPADAIRVSLLAELCGVALLGAGLELRSRDHAVPGLVVAGCGVLVALGSITRAAAGVPDTAVILRLVLGMLGVFLLSLGVMPVRETGSRALVKLGTGAVFVAVVVAGVFQVAGASTLLLAGTAAVVAWDVGENAINVGEQMGRAADTSHVELMHVGASGAVGVVVVLSGNLVRGIDTPTLSLPALATLLVAVILLVVALHE